MLYRQIGNLDIPMLGVGTYGVPEDVMPELFHCAIAFGACYVDSAYRYENEASIGRCFERGDIIRDEIILGTKLSYSQQMFGDVYKAVDDSLSNLKTDYIDLYFIHSPKSKTYVSDWGKLLRIRDTGKIRALAASNFGINQLEELYNEDGEYPVLNQIEIHPGCLPKELIQYCKEHDIAVQASCPLGRMSEKMLKSEVMVELSGKYHKTISQISLRWLLQQGILSIPRTSSIKHMNENYSVFDYEIDRDDMKLLDNTAM